MRILHTSDWHLDAKLEQNPRAREHQLFLDWLRNTLIQEKVSVLIIAGDVFDSGTPSNAAHLMYTRFLHDLYLDTQAGKSHCHYVLITAGNHDSPSFLNVSGPFLELLGMYVVTRPPCEPKQIKELVIPLKDENGRTRCIAALAPFLRERDLLPFVENREDYSDLSEIVRPGIRTFYRKLVDEALSIREELITKESDDWFELKNHLKPDEILREAARRIPIITTGHLFMKNAHTLEGDGVRPIHVGTLDQFPLNDFPPESEYTALGHLHQPQIVDDHAEVRYSGSPIPMNFSESHTKKEVILIETSDGKGPADISFTETRSGLKIWSRPIPVFQDLIELKGDFTEIEAAAAELNQKYAESDQNPSNVAWVKVIFTGETFDYSLRDQIEELFQRFTNLRLISFANQSFLNQQPDANRTILEDPTSMKNEDLFARFLTKMFPMFPDDEKQSLEKTFGELVLAFNSVKTGD